MKLNTEKNETARLGKAIELLKAKLKDHKSHLGTQVAPLDDLNSRIPRAESRLQPIHVQLPRNNVENFSPPRAKRSQVARSTKPEASVTVRYAEPPTALEQPSQSTPHVNCFFFYVKNYLTTCFFLRTSSPSSLSWMLRNIMDRRLMFILLGWISLTPLHHSHLVHRLSLSDLLHHEAFAQPPHAVQSVGSADPPHLGLLEKESKRYVTCYTFGDGHKLILLRI